MILLDTNVLSRLLSGDKDPRLDQWLDAQPSVSIWTTSITVMEIRYGIERLDAGRRREALGQAFERILAGELGGRVVEFDRRAGECTATLLAQRARAGRTVELRDTMIAGIALARRAAVATGNTRHFADAGIDIVDPWAA